MPDPAPHPDAPERPSEFLNVYETSRGFTFTRTEGPCHKIRVPFPWRPVVRDGIVVFASLRSGTPGLDAWGVINYATYGVHGWRYATREEVAGA